MARQTNRNSRTGLVLFIVVALAVSASWLGYYFRPSKTRVVERTQDDREYIYKCDDGHIFRAKGNKAPRKCTVEGCDADAYIYLIFACPNGHETGILIRSDPKEFCFDDDGLTRQWIPWAEIDQEDCPYCHTPGLMPARNSPG